MADWRRIQGRIRKARSSKDPAGDLATLYNDTRDAMVAYELAGLHEKTGNHAEAVQWYSTAATRFRRPQWKLKAQEALVRLGAEVPLPLTEAELAAGEPSGRAIHGTRHAAAAAAAGSANERSSDSEIDSAEMTGEPDSDTQEDEVADTESSDQLDTLPGMQTAERTGAADGLKKKRRRRGRRGGVRHRKRREAAEARHRPGTEPQNVAAAAPAETGAVADAEEIDEPQPTEEQVAAAMAAKLQHQQGGRPPRAQHARGQHRGKQQRERQPRQERQDRHGRRDKPQQFARPAHPPRQPRQSAPPPTPIPPPREPRHVVDETPDLTKIGPAAYEERQERHRAEAAAGGGRPEPALASRLAKLESQLRRLLASPAHPLDDVATAPAGPGVFVLSDSDLIDNYYVEACQTLRIGVGNMVRGGRMKDGGSLKSLLASYLGVPEAKVPKYLGEHCAVRWLQLDDGAPLLAHFATAVLQPALNILEA